MLRQFSASDVIFLGEQDGPPEQRLKEALAVLFRLNATVTRAYLARVVYGGTTSGVMLGIVADDEEDNEKLVRQLERAFAALFNTEAHLDIVFLNNERDAEIGKACPPFYDRNAGYH